MPLFTATAVMVNILNRFPIGEKSKVMLYELPARWGRGIEKGDRKRKEIEEGKEIKNKKVKTKQK